MSSVVSAFHLVTGLFALWFLYFVCWREHRVDAYRQRLFAVRDDLFDYAASGAIGFDDPAYMTLRDLSNGLIRYAHRMTFIRVCTIIAHGNLPRTNRMEAWVADVNTRSPEVRDKLTKAHAQVASASLWHVLAWSPLAWACVLASIVVMLLRIPRGGSVHVPRDISTVLEQEALLDSSLVEEDSCLVAV